MNDTQKNNLKIETTDLASRVNRLQDFMRTDKFYKLDRINKDLLYKQLVHMLHYLQVLGQRCELHGIKLDLKGV